MERLLLDTIFSGRLVLVYGEAATGKTHLAYHIYRLLLEKGRPASLIVTEPGSIVFLEYLGEKNYLQSRTMDELVEHVVREAASGKHVVVDSINWHYREMPGPEYARMLSLTSAIIDSVGGLATAQVALDGRPSGAHLISPWSGMIVRTSKDQEGLYRIEILRPFKRIGLFRIRRGNIEWI